VIGCGSFSFEMIRALVERLPVMITPRWVATPCQPIAVSDVLDYLRKSSELEFQGNAVFEIGGDDRVSYGEIMKEYARQRGLRRFMIPVPVLTPRLSSLWLALVTPYHARVGRALADSLRNQRWSTTPRGGVWHQDARRARSDSGCAGTGRRGMARQQVLAHVAGGGRRAGKSGRVPLYSSIRIATGGDAGGARRRLCAHPPDRRQDGWYCGTGCGECAGSWTGWWGAGVRAGRRDPDTLRPGDRVDFWRVEAFEPDRRLRLAAEMRVPGRAWLEFEVCEEKDGGSTIRQTAVFDPAGLFGLLYWYALYPVHQYVFGGMLRGIVSAAEKPPLDGVR
jgi:hypothetical protein